MTDNPNSNVINKATGKVRVIAKQCDTCIFHKAIRHMFERFVSGHVEGGSLVTCHETYVDTNPEFGPAVCAGYWASHRREAAAGIIAEFIIGFEKVDPPQGAQNE